MNARVNGKITQLLVSDRKYELGDMQSLYLGFIRSANCYQSFNDLNYYPQRIAAIEEQRTLPQAKQYSPLSQ